MDQFINMIMMYLNLKIYCSQTLNLDTGLDLFTKLTLCLTNGYFIEQDTESTVTPILSVMPCCGNSFYQQFCSTSLESLLLCVDMVSYKEEEENLMFCFVVGRDQISASIDPGADWKIMLALYCCLYLFLINFCYLSIWAFMDSFKVA